MALLFSDDFNRSDEELGASDDWTERGDVDWEIDTNTAEVKGLVTVGFSTAHTDASISADADYDVKCDWDYNSGAENKSIGVCARRVDLDANDSDLYMALMQVTGEGVFIQKRVAGSTTNLKSVAVVIDPEVVHSIELTMSGETLTLFLDDVEEGTVDDSSLTAKGDAGIISTTNSIQPHRADNFEVNGTAPVGGTRRMWISDLLNPFNSLALAVAPFVAIIRRRMKLEREREDQK